MNNNHVERMIGQACNLVKLQIEGLKQSDDNHDVWSAELAGLGLIAPQLAKAELAVIILRVLQPDLQMHIQVNGQVVKINPTDDRRDTYLSMALSKATAELEGYWTGEWAHIVEEAQKNYRESPEGIRRAAEREADRARIQSELDALLAVTPEQFKELKALSIADQFQWMLDFVTAADRIGVSYDADIVRNLFAAAGYVKNIHVIEPGSAQIPSNFAIMKLAEYAAGQILSLMDYGHGFPAGLAYMLETLIGELRILESESGIAVTNAGYFVGRRDKKRNTKYEGKYMVCWDVDFDQTTEDASIGGYCVVGDDLQALLDNTAASQL